MSDRFPDMPERMRRLPVDHRGFPIPFFVAWVAGVPHFPVADGSKIRSAWLAQKCWVCGEQMGRFQAFVIGPMCAVNRVSSEPPSHVDCARFSALHCPFLSRPRMKRVGEENLPHGLEQPAGTMIKRNPGVTALWIVRQRERLMSDGANGVLFNVGEPSAVEWYAEGRPAWRHEVIRSVKTGIPALLDMASRDRDPPGAFAELGRMVKAAVPFFLSAPRALGDVGSCIDCKLALDDVQTLGCTRVECPQFEGAMA